MKDIKIKAIEDIRGFSSGVSTERNRRLIAKRGRQGWIEFESDAKKLSKNHPYDFVDVLFDGNKIRRSVPNKSLKLVGGKYI